MKKPTKTEIKPKIVKKGRVTFIQSSNGKWGMRFDDFKKIAEKKTLQHLRLQTTKRSLLS